MHHLPPDCTPVICTPAADSEQGKLCQPAPDDQNTWILVPMDDGTIAWCKTSLPMGQQDQP